MTASKADFDKKTNCEKLEILSGIIEKNLIDFSEGKIDITQLAVTARALLTGYENNQIHDADFDCAACFDFDYYARLLFDTIENDGDLKNLEYKLQVWAKTKAEDVVIDNLTIPNNIFYTTGNPQVKNQLCYFDFNIYQQIEDRNLAGLVLSKDITVVYSPMHLEEVYRMNVAEYQNLRMDTITTVTNDFVLLRKTHEPDVYIEKPIHSYNRVLKNIPLSVALENKKVVKNKDRSIFFDSIQDDKFKYVLDNQDVFAMIDGNVFTTLLNFSGCLLLPSEFKKEDKTFDEILHMVYSLYDVLDNISFLAEKEKNDGRTIKSSVYDVEHLIYAAYTDCLVTADKKMARRAQQIYKYLGMDTKVVLIDKNFRFEQFLDGCE